MKKIRCNLILVSLLLIYAKSFAQYKSHIKITYVSCFSTFETWINESAFDRLGSKDSIEIYDKKNVKELIRYLNFSEKEDVSKLDFRIKIEVFKKGKCGNIYFFDNKGGCYHNGFIYKSEKKLLDYIKKIAVNIDCWE